MEELIIKLLFAHFFGDFILQPTKMVEDIKARRFRSPYLYIHILIHLLLLLVVTGFSKDYLIPVIILALSHFAIDIVTKILLSPHVNGVGNLIFDQIMHLLAIYLFINHFYNLDINTGVIFNSEVLLFIIALVILTSASSVFIKKVMEMFHYPIPNDGLYNAGKYIGMLERLFVFGFVVLSFWQGIGFLLAAKSIFRFGDLKEKKEIKLTEYILIGTLISFGGAIIIGVLYLNARVWLGLTDHISLVITN